MKVKVEIENVSGSVYRLINQISWNEYGFVATGPRLRPGSNELDVGSIIVQSLPEPAPINFYFNCYRVKFDGNLETLALYYEDKNWQRFNKLVNYYFKNKNSMEK